MNKRFLFAFSMSLAAMAPACGDTVVFGPAPDDGGITASSAGGTTATTDVGVNAVVTIGTGGSPPSVTVTTVGTGGAPTTSSTTGTGGGCVDVEAPLSSPPLPVDLIVTVVNSSSTSGAISAVEQSLASGLVSPLENAGVDLQTILISDHGTFQTNICMPPPLGTGNCSAPVITSPTFKHYSAQMPPGGVLCRVLDTIDGQTPDEFGLAPSGWQTWLRPSAYKAFLIFDASGVGCFDGMTFLNDQDDDFNGQQVALAFDDALLAAHPGQFGTTAERRYGVYFAGGFEPLNPNNTGIGPGIPTQFSQCGPQQFSAPGTGYQWLSKGTQALRFSACNSFNLTNIFPQTATSIESKVADRCNLTYAPQAGFNPTRVRLDPGAPNQPSEVFSLVVNANACGATKSFYFADVDQVKLCPVACNVAKTTPGSLRLIEPCIP